MKKKFAILIAVFILLLPALSFADTDTADGGNLLYNGDFSIFSQSADLPAGWELSAYHSAPEAVAAHMEIDEDYGRCIAIENFASNDARVCQTVDIAPGGGCYLVTAMVRTEQVSGERGANLSIDNYDLDGTFCFSPDASATSEWQPLSMIVRAGEEQTQLVVALRLGGYGSTAKGKAYFTGVCMQACDDPGADAAIDLPSQNGASGTAVSELSVAFNSDDGMFLLMCAATLLSAALFFTGYFLRWRDERTLLQPFETVPQNLVVLLAFAFCLRVVLSVIFVGHPTDIGCFMAWGSAVYRDGPAAFYTSGMFADYPPGYMYIAGALAGLADLMKIPYGSAAHVFLFKLPATAADLISAFLVFRLAKKNGLTDAFSVTLAMLVALCPVLMFISGAWGQIDSVLTLLVAAAFYLLQQKKRILAGALYGLAILMKPQALMFGPLLAVAYIVDVCQPADAVAAPAAKSASFFARYRPAEGWGRRLIETVLAVFAALAVIFLVSLPFKGTQSWDWIITKYYSTAGSYPYASIEAFNFPSLIGFNWRRIEEATILGASYRVFGSVAIVFAVLFSGWMYASGYRKNRGCLYLAGAFMIAMIFTFGHYMHERYLLPALLLLIVAYVFYRDRRILLSFGWLSAAALINALAAMYIVDHQSARGAWYNFITRGGSLIEVAGFMFLACVCADILLRNRILRADPKKIEQANKARATLAEASSPLRLPRSTDLGRMRYAKKELILLFALVFIYGAVALTNLGTMHSPESAWSSDSVGETVTVRFDGESTVSQYWVFGNIDTGGTLLFSATDGHEETFEQTYDDMFRWKSVDSEFTSSEVTIMLYSGSVSINEIAFFDAAGARIPVTVTSQTGHALFDEQDTVPDEPTYYNGMYFDELYHGRTAYEHLHNLSPYENSHPPLGKLLISLGIALFGMSPFGWRIVGALFGIGMLPVFYALARRIFKNAEYAFVATALFAFDFMHFTQTRIATIDVYAVFFILVMYYFMFRYISMNFFVEGLRSTLVPLGLCGVFFGVGAACKWTCFYAGAGLAVLFFASLVTRFLEYRSAMQYGSEKEKKRVAGFWNHSIATILFCCIFFVLIPFAIYFLSYLPYYIYEAGQAASYGIGNAFDTFWRYQEFMYSYHSGLTATHSYQSAWYQWPFTARPMWYFYTSFDGKLSTLTASGNPAVWWISSVGAVVLFALRAMKKIKRDRALQIIFIGVLANYLPWVLVSRCTFIYHFFATVPFLLLACVYLLQKFEEKEEAAWWLKWFWLGLAVCLFILLYPGLSGLPISKEWAAFIKNLPGGTLMYGA